MFESKKNNVSFSPANQATKKKNTFIQPKKKVIKPEQEKEPSPKIKLGMELIQRLAEGLNIIFYEIDDPVFKTESEAWAKSHDAIGLVGSQIEAGNIKFGKAIKERITIKEKTGKRELEIADIINELGEYLKESIKEAYYYQGKTDKTNLDLLLNSVKFKTVALGSHGYDAGTSLDINSENVASFLEKTTTFLANDVNIIFYACTIAKNEEEGYNQWYKVYNEDGGNNSLPAIARDKLSDLGHKEAETWGHTAVGHFLRNYTLRRFQASDKGKDGESFLLFCFKEEIDALVFSIIESLEKDVSYTKEITTEAKVKIRNLVYSYTKSDFRACYSSANKNLKINVGGEEKYLAEEAPLYPNKVKELILDYRVNKWTKKFDVNKVKNKVINVFKS